MLISTQNHIKKHCFLEGNSIESALVVKKIGRLFSKLLHLRMGKIVI